MKNNQGITLVELLVALAIGAIVMAGLATLIGTSIKLYGKSSASVDLQNEAQTSLNLLVDSAMEANGLELVQNSLDPSKTQEVYLGTYVATAGGSVYGREYIGKVILCKENTTKGWSEIYLSDYQSGDMQGNTDTQIKTNIKTDMTNNATAYLLAQYVTSLSVDIAEKNGLNKDGTAKFDTSGSTFYYTDPISLEIKISFRKNNSSGETIRTISDKAGLRNRIDKMILTNVLRPNGTSMSGTYYLKK